MVHTNQNKNAKKYLYYKPIKCIKITYNAALYIN